MQHLPACLLGKGFVLTLGVRVVAPQRKGEDRARNLRIGNRVIGRLVADQHVCPGRGRRLRRRSEGVADVLDVAHEGRPRRRGGGRGARAAGGGRGGGGGGPGGRRRGRQAR